jgi:hypothetical protein
MSVGVMTTDERLKAKVEGSIHLEYTGLCGGLEHLKIERRLRIWRSHDRYVEGNVSHSEYVFFFVYYKMSIESHREYM